MRNGGVKVADMGISRVLIRGEQTVLKEMTLIYASPEVVNE